VSETAETTFERGKKLLDANKYAEALKVFQELARTDPSQVNYILHEGLAHDYLDQATEAISDYGLAIRLDPNCTPAYYYRGVLYGEQEKYDQAIKDFERAVQLDPKDPDYHLMLGESHYWLGHGEEAIRSLSQAIALDPENAATFRRRGQAYMEKQEFQKSLDDLNKSNVLDPDNPRTLAGIAMTYLMLGQPRSAIPHMDRAVTLEPDYEPSFRIRGMAYLDLNENQKAADDLNRAVQLNPNDLEAQKALQDAQQRLSGRIKILPTPPPEAFESLMRAGELLESGTGETSPAQLREAERHLQSAISRASGVFPRAQAVLAIVYYQLGDTGAAQRNAERALADNPDEFRAQWVKTLLAGDKIRITTYNARGLLPRGTGALYIFEVIWKIIKGIFETGVSTASQVAFKNEVVQLLEIYRQLCQIVIDADEWLYLSDRLLVLADLMTENRLRLPGGTPDIYREITRTSSVKMDFDPEQEAEQRRLMAQITATANSH